MIRLDGKTCIVTGASKGIGAGIAKAMGAAGAAVVVNYATSAQGADRTVAAITAASGRAIAVQADVSDPAAVKRLFAQTVEAFGGVDILVNNAAVYEVAPLAAITLDQIRRQLDTNILGTILTIQEAARLMGPQGGSIINIGSIDSRRAAANMAVYAATKGGVDALTRAFAMELGSRGIRVNTLAPGGTHTEGVVDSGFIGSTFETAMIARTPLGRLGQPEDIAKVAVFLASAESGWMTGDRIVASGGFVG